jgi:hypothetical protein
MKNVAMTQPKREMPRRKVPKSDQGFRASAIPAAGIGLPHFFSVRHYLQ